MDTIEAIIRLAKLGRTDSGASGAARSVLVYAWNPHCPIRELYRLDIENRRAALIIIDHALYIEDEIIKKLVPEISDWAIEQEELEMSGREKI